MRKFCPKEWHGIPLTTGPFTHSPLVCTCLERKSEKSLPTWSHDLQQLLPPLSSIRPLLSLRHPQIFHPIHPGMVCKSRVSPTSQGKREGIGQERLVLEHRAHRLGTLMAPISPHWVFRAKSLISLLRHEQKSGLLGLPILCLIRKMFPSQSYKAKWSDEQETPKTERSWERQMPQKEVLSERFP